MEVPKPEVAEKARMLDIYFMGRHYQVPEGLTIQTALEYCGYRLVRGCGCRIGSCGACATVYNFKDDSTLRYGLACRTAIEQDMCVVQIPYFPTSNPIYDLRKLRPTNEQVLKIYPELATCLGCNSCTKACPLELEVLDSVSAALRGDFFTVTEKSLECVMCGMCAARCPQGISPYNIMLLIRRLHGRYLTAKPRYLEARIEEIEAGKFDHEYENLKSMPIEEFRHMYERRWIEPK